jgi:hypothetical protein
MKTRLKILLATLIAASGLTLVAAAPAQAVEAPSCGQWVHNTGYTSNHFSPIVVRDLVGTKHYIHRGQRKWICPDDVYVHPEYVLAAGRSDGAEYRWYQYGWKQLPDWLTYPTWNLYIIEYKAAG